MNRDLESEVEKLKAEKVVSEETAAIYLTNIKKKLEEESLSEESKDIE